MSGGATTEAKSIGSAAGWSINSANANNDNFADRLVLTGAEPLVTNDNTMATIEVGEKMPAKGMANASLWYQWTAPASGLTRIYASAGFVPVVSVFKGTSLKKLKMVANSLKMTGNFVYCQIHVNAGDTFMISVDGRSPGGRGVVMVGVDVTTFQISSPLSGAIINAATPPLFSVNAPSPLVDGALQSVSYIVGQANGVTRTVGFSTTPPFSVTPTNLPAGVIGLLAVGTNEFGGARVSAAIPLVVRPANDDFAHSVPLQGYHWELTGVTAQATHEQGEPNSGAASVWWTWIAPSSGQAEIEAQLGEARSPLHKRNLVVYSGTDLKHLKRVPWTSFVDNQDASKYFDFDAVGGTTYQIVVAAKNPNLDPGFDPFLLRGNLTSLRFTEPTTNVFHEPANVPVGITTTENPADIQRVDFFASDGYETNELIGSVGTPPYRFIWSNAPPGDYSLEARVVKLGGPAPLTAGSGVSIRPLNDDLANAIIIETNFTWMTQRIAGASREEGEPTHTSGPLSNPLASAWWTWTAPANGRVYVGNPNGDPAAGVAIYTGTNVAALVRVPNHNDPIYGPNEVVDVVQGTVYQIAAIPGSVPKANLQFRFYPPPANDNFSNRIALTGTNIEMAGYTVGATRESNEPNHAGFTQDHTVWWSWTAPGRGHVTLRQDAGIWLILGVYTGSSLDALNIVSSDGSLFGGWDFEVQPGVTYQFAVVSYWGNEEHVAVNLNFAPAIENDSFAARKILEGTNLVIAADNRGGTVEQGEPPLAPNGSGRTLWWTWTAPADGNFYLRAPGSYSLINGMLSVYTGDSLNALQLVTAGDIFRLSFHATSNTTYQIRFDTSGYITVPVPVSLDFIPAPENDNFSNAAVLNGLDVATNGSMYGSSDEDAWPSVKGGETVWYSWTATSSQSVIARVTGNLTIHAYTGATRTNLVAAGVQHQFDSLLLNPQPGRTYYFQLFGEDLWEPDYPWAGEYEMFLTPGSAPANDDLANAQVIPGTSAFVEATNWVASLEPTDPAIVQWDNLKRTIWYRWQAPANGLLSITNAGSDMDLVIAMWFGTNFGQFVSGGINGTTLSVSSNNVISILVDGNSGVGGVIRLGLAFTPAAQNAGANGIGISQNHFTQSSAIATVPSLSPVGRLSDGQFTLKLLGASGSPYKVEWSAEMIHWQPLQSGTLTNGFEEVTDPDATSPARFYRLVPQQ